MTGIYPPLPPYVVALADGGLVCSGDEVVVRAIDPPDGSTSRGQAKVRRLYDPYTGVGRSSLCLDDRPIAHERCALAAVHRRGWYFHHYTGEKEQ